MNAPNEQALNIAKKAMKIVIFIGMIAVVLLMINIYILLNQITATAQISKEVKLIKQVLNIADFNGESKDVAQSSIDTQNQPSHPPHANKNPTPKSLQPKPNTQNPQP
ncbi:DUF5408 family protein [Helicobacter sp. T3_23-1056]